MVGIGGATRPGPGGNGGRGDPDAARDRLVSQLRSRGRATSQAVVTAFRVVPRHLFLPELTPAEAYSDEAIVVKTGAGGLPLSSSSQPAMMAIMLEQLALAPGQRVLEIGTGTGYNAALIAYLVGERGSVVTVDIDADLVARARDSLAAAGYPEVAVYCGDGALGVPDHAPYDRIIVTVGAWDLSPDWLAQLRPGGRIVLPLSVRGIQLSVALDHGPDYWVSRSACSCGFIRMVGAFAGPESFVSLGPQPGLHVLAEDGRQIDTSALYAALTGPVTDVAAGVRVVGIGDLGDLDLWLAVTEPRLTRINVMGREAARGLAPALLPFGGLTDADGEVGDFAVAALIPAGSGAPPASAESAGQPGLRAAPEESDVAPDPGVAGPAAPDPGVAASVEPDPGVGGSVRGSAEPSGCAARPGVVMASKDLESHEATESAPGSTGPAEPAGHAGPAAPRRRSGFTRQTGRADVTVRGFGPGGADLAAYLAGRVRAWHDLGRPGVTGLSLRVYPAGAPVQAPSWTMVVDKQHTRLVLGWPGLTGAGPAR
jgi:protein-L-isoaspartate(D-aspartate) O-methyltransferase